MAGIKLYQFLLNGQAFTDPENWKSFIPTIETHETYKTLLAQFSSESMTFVKDAKDYVDSQYAEKGALSKVTIQITKYNLDTGLYENYFTAGRLDFKRYKRKRDRTEVGFEPSDFVMKILNRDEVKLSLQKLEDMDGNAITPFTNETIDLELDQQTFVRELIGSLENEIIYEEDISPVGEEPEDIIAFYLAPDVFEKNEFADRIDEDIPIAEPIQIISSELNLPSKYGIYQATRDAELEIDIVYNYVTGVDVTTKAPALDGTVSYSIVHNFHLIHRRLQPDETYDDLFIDIEIMQSDNVASENTGTVAADASISLSGTFSQTLNVNKGDIVLLYSEINRGSFTCDTEVLFERYFNPTTLDIDIKEFLTDPTTTAKCMLAWEFILRQCQIITGRNDCLRSSFYGRTDGEVYQYLEDGTGSMYAFSNGKLIRGFPIAQASISTFLMQTFKNLEGMGHLLGLGITYESDVPYITIEPLTFWKDKSTVVMTLQADENGIEWEPAIKYMWGSVKCGYANYKNESSFLLGTAHALKEYSLADINEISNTIYEITSDLVASGHLLENIRNQRYALDTQKDTDYDESIFVIAVKRDGLGGFERKKITEFETVTGIDNVDSQYNIELHPARVLLNHAPLLLAAYAKRIANEPIDKTFLQFRSGEANNELETKYATKTAISEGVDLTFDELDGQEALFDASEMGSCTVNLTDAQIQQFKSGFIGAINVSDQTGTYKCLVDMVKQTNLENNKTELRIFKVIE